MLKISKKLLVIICCGLILTTIIATAGCDETPITAGQYDETPNNLPARVIKGPVKISYKFKTSETSWTSTSTPIEVSEIRMFEEYIIITEKANGITRLIPVSSIVYMNWK